MWHTRDETLPLKASGMIYRSAYYTPEIFEAKTGVRPTNYPQYFRITRTGLVECKPEFSVACETYWRHTQRNFNLLGV